MKLDNIRLNYLRLTEKEASYVLSFVGMKKKKGAARNRAMIIKRWCNG